MTHPVPILAATDLSGLGRMAAWRAAGIARACGGALTLMHVVPGSTLEALEDWLGEGHAAAHAIEDESRQRLDALADELRRDHDVPVQVMCARGSALDEIPRVADAADAALVVVGARGQGFLRRLVLGTTAERLLRRTTRPLLVVRASPHERYRRALVAIDFSPWSRGTVALARVVAPQVRPVLFHAWQVPFEEKLRSVGVTTDTIAHYRQRTQAEASRLLVDMATAAGLTAGTWESCVIEGDPSQRLIEAAIDRDCDLVVLGKHGRSATADLLLGSVTRHVLADGTTDVLVSTASDTRSGRETP